MREAIEVSSSSLSETLDRIEAGDVLALPKLERAVFAATRYVLRMCTRATPFGLLAGVATGTFGSAAKVRLGQRHEKSVRVDAGWLTELADDLERQPEIRRLLRFQTNNLCRPRGGRLVLSYVHGAKGARRQLRPDGGGSIRLTPVVAAAIELARQPIRYAELSAGLRRRFPDATESAIDALVAQLVEKQFLLTDLRPHPAETDPVRHVSGIVADTPLGAALANVEAAIDRYEWSPIGAGRADFRSAVGVLAEQFHTAQPPLQVELRYDADFELPATVAREIERAAGAVYRMAPQGLPAHLSEYHVDFLERYGADQAVPILELLDPNTGLDAPAGYRLPASARELRHGLAERYERQRAEIVNELSWTAARDGGDLVLDDETVDRLSGSLPARIPAAIEVCVQLFANSVDDLDRGRFTAAMATLGGSTRPGAMVGRFLHVLGDQPELTRLAQDSQNGLPVQILSYPITGRSGNLSAVPQLVPDVLPVAAFADPHDHGVIDIDDVAVRADADRLYVVRQSTGQVLRPMLPHMLNTLYEYPNVVQLLLDIEQNMAAPITRWWDWGRLDRLPTLPRVRYGRTILAPAQWRPGGQLADAKQSWSRWCETLAAWRERWAVPARVEATTQDHRIELDLDVDLHRQLLRQEIRRGADLVLTESLTASGAGLGWLDGHAAEFVVQLRGAPVSPAQPSRFAAAPKPARLRYEPGTEWLYAKVYGAESTQDTVLTHVLPALLANLPEGVDRWFFIRYRDPDPHLRIRFHGDPDVLNGVLLPRLGRWAAQARDRGSIRRLALDTYEPEVNRYGGPAAMLAAEELFRADSEAVIGQLQRRTGDLQQLPIELVTAINYVDILGSLGDWDWMRWAAEHLGKGPDTGIDRELRSLVDPARTWTRLAELPGGTELIGCWTARAKAAAEFGRHLFAEDRPAAEVNSILSSVLHMHANRLMGVHKHNERMALSALREQVRSYRIRAAATA